MILAFHALALAAIVAEGVLAITFGALLFLTAEVLKKVAIHAFIAFFLGARFAEVHAS